jgi:hypothetical protein
MSYSRTITNGTSVSQQGGESFDQQLDDLQTQIDGVSGGSAPTGTGFVKVTSGVYDTPAALSATEIRGTVTGTAGEGKVIADDGASGLEWITPSATDSTKIPLSLIDAKGDLLLGTANDTAARQAVGANNTLLVANSGQTNGVEWRALVPGDMPNLGCYVAVRITSDQTGITIGYAQNTVLFNSASGENFTDASGVFTATAAGRYLIVAQVDSAGSVTAYGSIDKYTLATTTWAQECRPIPNNATVPKTSLLVGIVDLVVGDKLRISWYCGGAETINYAGGLTRVKIAMIGKAA